MYSVRRGQFSGEIIEWNEFNAFKMESRHGFHINGEVIRFIDVIDKKLAYPIVSKKVMGKYSKLIPVLTNLIISDDESGDPLREALNHIEKFRLEIKNKYRDFLKKKELEMMSKQLATLKKEAESRLLEIHEAYIASKSSGKGK